MQSEQRKADNVLHIHHYQFGSMNPMFGFLRSTTLSPRLLRLKESALFAMLTPLELKIVDGLMHERRYLADEIIFDEGEEGQALYVVMSGRVLVSREVGATREVVAELSAGAFFGDMALLDNSPRNAQTRALDNCELAVFFRADFMGLMETDAVIGYKIALALARHIGGRLREWMTGTPHAEAL
jgi:CRP/FNR family cyclic AMP-dependent transcriptional regulator